MHRLSIQQIYREIDEVIRYLTRESTILNPEFIHFERQVSYIYADEKRIVDSIYPLENLKGMFKEIGYILGQNFAVPPRENQSVAYRSRFIGLMAEQSKRRLLSMGGRSLPDPIRKIARRFVYVPPRRHFSEIMNSVTIRDFVTSYYARDLVLYENIRAGS